MVEDGQANTPARIAVGDIVSMYERLGRDTKRVYEEVYPHLEPEAIEVALVYYACHQDEVDRLIREQAAEDELAHHLW
jgi:uncharacterized protein (DUF433 family)